MGNFGAESSGSPGNVGDVVGAAETTWTNPDFPARKASARCESTLFPTLDKLVPMQHSSKVLQTEAWIKTHVSHCDPTHTHTHTHTFPTTILHFALHDVLAFSTLFVSLPLPLPCLPGQSPLNCFRNLQLDGENRCSWGRLECSVMRCRLCELRGEDTD